MKIIILGSGSAFGIPMMFNVWGNANPDNIKNQRTRASIIIEDEGKSILIDADPELRLQINANNIKNIDAVLITHCHYDHIAGIPELSRATKTLDHQIEIYAATYTMQELKKSYYYLFNTDIEPESCDLCWKTLPDKGEFKIGALEFKTMLFPHNSIYSSAFRYKNFAYLTDWGDFAPGWEDFLKDLDILIVECNNGTYNEDNGHSNLERIQELMKKVSPKKIIISHISRRIDHETFEKILPSNCKLAYDGMSLDI